jgi:hypothetical protein
MIDKKKKSIRRAASPIGLSFITTNAGASVRS